MPKLFPSWDYHGSKTVELYGRSKHPTGDGNDSDSLSIFYGF